MSEKWVRQIQEEIEELQGSKSNEAGDDNALPYFLVMKDYNLLANKGTCIVSFIVTLDDDVGNDGNKIILQRAASSRIVVFSADVSVKLRPGTSIQEPSMSYPFFEPEVTLTYGAGYFPSSSDINVSNGDRLKLDQWDSSLRIRDAAVSIATLVRRSIRSGNLCLKVEKREEDDEHSDETSSTSSSGSGGGLLGKIKRLKQLRGILKKAEADADANADAGGDSALEHTESREARKIRKLRELRASRTKSEEVVSDDEDLGGDASLKEVLSAIAEPDNYGDPGPALSESPHNTYATEDVDTEVAEKGSVNEGRESRVASMTRAFEQVYRKTQVSSPSKGNGNEGKDDVMKQVTEGLVKNTSDEDTAIYDTVTESVDEILSVISEGDEEYEDDTNHKEQRQEELLKHTNESRKDEQEEEVSSNAWDDAVTPSKGIQSLMEIYEKPNESLDELLDEDSPPKRGYAEEFVQKDDTSNKSSNEVDAHVNSKVSSVVSIGDVVDIDQHPYNQAHGLYSCEVIRRPEFIETRVAAEDIVSKNLHNKKGGIFQEQFVMVTEEQIIEIRRPRNTNLWGDRAKIVFAMPIISLLRIRFSTEKGSILLYFREDRSEALEYVLTDCAKAAKVIQSILEKCGFYSRHRSAAMEKARKYGLELCKEISSKQSRLGRKPSFNQVQEIIDLHCLAAEKLEYSHDDRYTEVISHLRRFLSKPKIAQVLNDNIEGKTSVLTKIQLSSESISAMSDISSVTSNTQSVGSRSLDDQSGHSSLNEILDHGEKIDANLENNPASENFEDVGNKSSLHKEPPRFWTRGRSPKPQDDRIPFQRRIVI